MSIVRWTGVDAAARLRRPDRHDDKYRRGVLGMRIGSAAYPGAAVLGVSAAWRAGVGLLRYIPPEAGGSMPRFGLPSPAAAVLAAHPETVFGPPTSRPCDAWVIGSGTEPGTRTAADRSALLELLAGDAPVIVDAGALDLVAAAARDGSLRAPAILTPHSGEFERLWTASGLGEPPMRRPEREAAHAQVVTGAALVARASRTAGEARELSVRSEAAARLARHLGVTVLLKGSTSIAVSPAGPAIVCGPATPWLASAGTGDVLAGALGALLANAASTTECDAAGARVGLDHDTLAALAATAAVLHDTAARLAADDPEATGSGRPITALDVAEALPEAWNSVLSSGTEPDAPPR